MNAERWPWIDQDGLVPDSGALPPARLDGSARTTRRGSGGASWRGVKRAERAERLAPPVAAIRTAPATSRWRQNGVVPKTVQAAADLLAITSALWLTVVVGGTGEVPATALSWIAAASVPCWLLVLARYQLLSGRHVQRMTQEVSRLVHAVAAGVGSTALVALLAGVEVSGQVLLLGFAVVTVVLTFERVVSRLLTRYLHRSGRLTRRVLVVGGDSVAASLSAALDRDPSLGCQVIGFLDDTRAVGTLVDAHREVLGAVDDAVEIVRRTRAQGVVIVPGAVAVERVNVVTRLLAGSGIHVEVLTALRGIAPERLSVGSIGMQFGVIRVRPCRLGSRYFAKRAFDVVVALVGLVLAAPLLVVLAVAIAVDSPGPVLFRQWRLGRDGVTFELLKLRSMTADAESRLEDLRHLNEADGPLFKLRRDPRVTRVGRYLRCMSLDELPQLWNVLRGEMSIVGPRPALPAEAEAWEPELHQRLRVRPGITGMWQVNSRAGSDFEDYVELDLYYVDNWSLPMDLKIVLQTVPSVLLERGAR